MWLHRKPEDWTLSWGGAGVIYGWGHNHRGQLGGVDGAKVKIPTPCETLSALRPVQLVGGEQTLFAITSDGKVYATGMWKEYLGKTRKYPLRRYILDSLAHTTALDKHWGEKTLK